MRPEKLLIDRVMWVFFLCSCLAVTGCSVGMALSGKEEPNLGAIRKGCTRGQVELQLGSPVKSVTNTDGTRVDIYEYEIGNKPSAGRALGHGVMDVLTFGLWEVIGTPIEGFQGEKHRITITYDQNDCVLAINTAPVPKQKGKQQAEAVEIRADEDTTFEEAMTKARDVTARPIVNPPIAQSAVKPISDKWAVVIGVANYKDSRIPSLRYCGKDAQAFYEWLISPEGGRYSPARVKLLIDERATLNNIRRALFVWLGQPIEEDLVTIYFSGHGTPESPDTPEYLFLLPYDTDYESIAATALSISDVQRALHRYVKAEQVVLLADACHAGGLGSGFDSQRKAIQVTPHVTVKLSNLTETRGGLAVITAADDKQLSQEHSKWGGGHGVFTWYLLNGLQGEADYTRDGKVTLGELFPYISEKVRRETKNQQYPTIAGKFDPSLTLSK